MSSKFIDLYTAAEMIGNDGSVEKVISKIQEGVLTAYARIHCWHQNDYVNIDTNDDNDNDEKYEIARIANIKDAPPSHSFGSDKGYFIKFEPIDSLEWKNNQENRLYDANLASDNYGEQRVFGYIKSRPSYNDLVSTEQICLLPSDIIAYLSGENPIEINPAKVLAERRHKTKTADIYADKVIRTINEKKKDAQKDCKYINHHRFVKEANVPEHLVNSVKEKVRLRIKSDFFGSYQPLSRRPKNEEEDYFLLR